MCEDSGDLITVAVKFEPGEMGEARHILDRLGVKGVSCHDDPSVIQFTLENIRYALLLLSKAEDEGNTLGSDVRTLRALVEKLAVAEEEGEKALAGAK